MISCTYRSGKFYHRLTYQNLPHYFQQFNFPRQLDIHPYPTRDRHLLVIPWLRYQLSKSSIKNRLPQLINQAPKIIMDKMSTHSLYGLSFYLKRVYINAYQTDCTNPNCYVRSTRQPISEHAIKTINVNIGNNLVLSCLQHLQSLP